MRWIAAGLAVLALAACAGPRPQAPSAAMVTAPPQWRTTPDAGARVDGAWWASFGDPALTAVVETALARNTDIAVAAARVEEARGQFRLAQAQRRLDVSGSIVGGRQRFVSPFATPDEQTYGEGDVDVAYDLDLFGRLRNASKAARASLLATEAARDGVRLAVAASAAGGYITLRALDARLAVLRGTLRAREESLALTRRRTEAGYSPRLDLQQAEAEYYAAAQLIPATEAAIARQENGLAVLLGDNPRSIARGRALDELRLPAVPAGLPADLLRRRPDLAQAEQQIVAADRSLDSVRAAFMPDIQLTVSGGWIGTTALVVDPIGLWNVGGSVLGPIFDAGRLRAQQSTAAARRDQAAFAYRKAALTAFSEVDNALNAERRLAEQAKALDAQRDALARALVLATNRYRSGYATYLEQLDAERSLLSADLTVVQVRSDRLTTSVTLFQALGGGWSTPPVDRPRP